MHATLALQERKSLLSGNFKDKHHLWGSFLLAAGVGMSIEGAANTFMRTGKLFPGPHLFAGEREPDDQMQCSWCQPVGDLDAV